jgi:hypothetical protein
VAYIQGDQAEEEREVKAKGPLNTQGAKLSEIGWPSATYAGDVTHKVVQLFLIRCR